MPALLLFVVFFQKRGQVHVHELGASREAATYRDLDAALGQIQFGWRKANPDPEWIAPELFDEVLHGQPLVARRYATPNVPGRESVYGGGRSNVAGSAGPWPT